MKTPSTPIIARCHARIPLPHYPAHLTSACTLDGCSAGACATALNVKIFQTCQRVSAALECLHQCNMFINTFIYFFVLFFFFPHFLPPSPVGETSRDDRVINQEVCACKSSCYVLDAHHKATVPGVLNQDWFVCLFFFFLFFSFAYIKIARWTIFFINVFSIKSRVMLQLIYCAKLQVIETGADRCFITFRGAWLLQFVVFSNRGYLIPVVGDVGTPVGLYSVVSLKSCL